MKRFAPIIVLALACSGCGVPLKHYTGYRGDGEFMGHAAPSVLCQDGYTVDLGGLDLTSTAEVDRTLDGLPPIQSIIGISIAQKSSGDMPRPAALITVTLRDEQAHIVLSRHEPLSDWTKEYSIGDPQHGFLYQRGTLADIPVAPGAARVERFPLGRDDSWGTYFTPRRGAHYTLHFSVDEPDAASAAIDARLQVRGVVGCL
jgi:hypothetical protein